VRNEPRRTGLVGRGLGGAGRGESTECDAEGGRECENECDAYGSDQSESSGSRLKSCVDVEEEGSWFGVWGRERGREGGCI